MNPVHRPIATSYFQLYLELQAPPSRLAYSSSILSSYNLSAASSASVFFPTAAPAPLLVLWLVVAGVEVSGCVVELDGNSVVGLNGADILCDE